MSEFNKSMRNALLDIYDAQTISKATGIKNPVVSGIDDAGLAKAIKDIIEANN